MNNLTIILALVISSTIVKSQGIIQGTVLQNDSTTLSSVSVYLENTKWGTSSNSLGNFKLSDIPSGEYTVILSSLGYKKTSQKVNVKDNETINLKAFLTESATDLSEFTLTSTTSMTGGHSGMKKMPGSAYYISPKELSRFSYSDINRSLRSVPGVNITEEDGFGLRTNIGLRGTGSERTSKITVMEDGILISPAPYTAPAAYYFPTAGRIQAVEIMKGSSQIKYGPYTTGGAINLISTQIPDTFSGKINILAGTYNFKQLHATIGNAHKNFAYMVETFQYGSDGFKKLDVEGNTGFDKKDYLAKFRINTNSTAKVYQALTFKIAQANEISDETYLGLTEEDFKKNHIRRYAGSQVDLMTTQQRSYSIKHLIKPTKYIDVNTTGYYTEFERNWYKLNNLTDTSGKNVNISDILENPAANSNLMNIIKGNSSINNNALTVRANNRSYLSKGIQTNISLNFNSQQITHKIDVGIRYHQDEMDRFQWDDKYQMKDGKMLLTSAGEHGTQDNKIESAKAIASYIQYRITYKKLTFTPGVRHESIIMSKKDFGKNDITRKGINLKESENKIDVFIPGANVDYQFTKQLNSFIGIHKGFAPPGSTPNVTHEESINYEVGATYYKNSLTIKMVGFINDYKNLLGTDLEAGGGSGTNDLFNGGKAQTQGIEFFASYDFLSKRHNKYKLPISLAYTFMNATFNNSFNSSFEPWGTVTKGDELPYIAKNQFNIMLAFETDKLSFNVRGNYCDAMRTIASRGDILDEFKTDNYFVLDFSTTYQLTNQLSVFGSISNIMNNEYMVARRPAGLRPGMPRMFIIGLKANF